MSSNPTNDLATAFRERDNVTRWSAERDNATARLELAQLRERMALVLSQCEPVDIIGVDRDGLRIIIDYIRSGQLPPEIAVRVTKHGGRR
jgi:hypothetical protein